MNNLEARKLQCEKDISKLQEEYGSICKEIKLKNKTYRQGAWFKIKDCYGNDLVQLCQIDFTTYQLVGTRGNRYWKQPLKGKHYFTLDELSNQFFNDNSVILTPIEVKITETN